MESPHTPHALRIQEMVKAIAAKKAGTPKPTLEQFNGDAEAHGKALELWRIAQEVRLAEAVLDNAASSVSARERANKIVRSCAKRRKKIEADSNSTPAHIVGIRRFPFLNCIDDSVAPTDDPRPWSERFPYDESQRSRFSTPKEARVHHKNLSLALDEFERIGKMSPEEQEACWEVMDAERITRAEEI
jgi:hypothetical protein